MPFCVGGVEPQKIEPVGVILRAFLLQFNQLEFIAVGIRLGVFDEAIYKELSHSNVVETWRTVSGFACELRRQTEFPTLFQDLENLAKKWEKDPIKRI